MVLSCQNISKSFGDKCILNKISFHINDGQKVALIGNNGAGKSTLFKIITGEYSEDSGVVSIKKDASIGYLSQHQDYSSPNTVYEELLEVKKDLIAEEEAIREMENEMNTLSEDELSKHMEKYHSRLHSFDLNGGYTFRSDINGILNGLKFSESDYNKAVTSLSGGERTRLLLGRILLEKPDLILLDEPTNYLDIESVEWLENYLANVKSAVLVVSHDRYFINKVVSAVIEIDQAKGIMYDGNYDDFMIKKEVYKQSLISSYENQQREIKHQEEVIRKLRSFNREKSIKRADSRQKLLDKMERLDKPVEVKKDMELSLSANITSGNDVLSVKNLKKSYGSRTLFSNVSFEIKRGEHIALIGKNGCGKTTILKIINELLDPDEGEFELGNNVQIGYFDQQSAVLDESKSIFDEISDTYPKLTQTEIRNVLAAFLFTNDEVFQIIKSLSGGERGRVVLAKLMLSGANFLILDEPTNHLDMISKEILENALNDYEGTVLYVSHDRYFINRTAGKILCLSENSFDEYLGDYDYYIEKSREKENFNNTSALNTISSDITKKENASEQKIDWQKQKEEQALKRKKENQIKKIEAEIEKLEAEIAELEVQMSDQTISNNSVKLQEIYNAHTSKSEKLAELYEQWETLSE